MASILVVDDDLEVLEVLSRAIKLGGHRVLEAVNGIAALDVLDSDVQLDLLLTDVIMSGLNGFNLARIAKMRRPGLKIMFLTGFHEQALIMGDPLEKLGKLLSKPIGAAELRKEVDEVLAISPR